MNDSRARVDKDDKVTRILTTDNLGFKLQNTEELAMKYIVLNNRCRKLTE